jgi:hypothetical protein
MKRSEEKSNREDKKYEKKMSAKDLRIGNEGPGEDIYY